MSSYYVRVPFAGVISVVVEADKAADKIHYARSELLSASSIILTEVNTTVGAKYIADIWVDGENLTELLVTSNLVMGVFGSKWRQKNDIRQWCPDAAYDSGVTLR